MSMKKQNKKIPKGWEMVCLREVCEIARGGSPRPIENFITNEEYGINWIKIGDVGKEEKYITETKEKIKPDGISKTKLVKEGDFILSNSMSFGRPYILKISGAIHDGWLLLRLKNNNVLPDFLYYVLRSSETECQFKNSAIGGVVRNLNINIVKDTQIVLPPLKEQKKIAGVLGVVDEEIGVVGEIVEKYEVLRRGLMQDFFVDGEKEGWEEVRLSDLC